MARRKKSKEELEELTRTQVLNLQELEKAAKYEKKTSRKPAAILAVIGVFSISLGLCYPGVNSMLNSRKVESKPTVSERREKDNVVDENVLDSPSFTCTFRQENVTDATLVNTTYNFQFLDMGTLKYYEKVMDISVASPVTQTPASIVSLDTSLANLVQTPITGYLLEKTPSASTNPSVVDGYQAKLAVDFQQFNLATLTTLHTTNTFANVEFNAQDTWESIQARLVSLGYTCK